MPPPAPALNACPETTCAYWAFIVYGDVLRSKIRNNHFKLCEVSTDPPHPLCALTGFSHHISEYVPS